MRRKLFESTTLLFRMLNFNVCATFQILFKKYLAPKFPLLAFAKNKFYFVSSHYMRNFNYCFTIIYLLDICSYVHQ